MIYPAVGGAAGELSPGLFEPVVFSSHSKVRSEFPWVPGLISKSYILYRRQVK